MGTVTVTTPVMGQSDYTTHFVKIKIVDRSGSIIGLSVALTLVSVFFLIAVIWFVFIHMPQKERQTKQRISDAILGSSPAEEPLMRMWDRDNRRNTNDFDAKPTAKSDRSSSSISS